MLYADIEKKLLASIKKGDPYKNLKQIHIKRWYHSYLSFFETGGKKGLNFISQILSDESCWEKEISIPEKLNLNRNLVAKQLLELTIKNSEKNPFDIFDRYRIACWCCLEEDIQILFQELKNQKKDKKLDFGDLMIFWSHLMSGLEDQLTLGRNLFLYGFECAITEKRLEALEFFWKKLQLTSNLSSEEKDALLIQVALYKACNGNANGDMVNFCLRYINPAKYIKLLKKDFNENGYYSTLKILRDEDFIENAEMLSEYLNLETLSLFGTPNKTFFQLANTIGTEKVTQTISPSKNQNAGIYDESIRHILNKLIPSPIDTNVWPQSIIFNDKNTAGNIRIPKQTRPIFVVGCPRSGTTLVGSCLAAHRQLIGSEESLFLLCLWQIFSDLHQGGNRRGWAPLSNYISSSILLDTIGHFSDSIFCSLSSEVNKHYLDHTPWYILLIPFIKKLYPDSIFIHIIRNGLDVVNSLATSCAKGFEWAGPDHEARTKLWRDCVMIGKNFGSTLSQSEYLELHYEDLCHHPEVKLKELVNKLNLDWDEKCLYPLAIEHAGPSRSKIALATLSKDNLTLNKVPKDSHFNAENWSIMDKEIFLAIAGDTMKNCNYIKPIEDLQRDLVCKESKKNFTT